MIDHAVVKLWTLTYTWHFGFSRLPNFMLLVFLVAATWLKDRRNQGRKSFANADRQCDSYAVPENSHNM
jgi:hypothetical protein